MSGGDTIADSTLDVSLYAPLSQCTLPNNTLYKTLTYSNQTSAQIADLFDQ